MTEEKTNLEGGCYCGEIRYAITAAPVFKGQCHCRQCQYFSGGGPNYFMIVPADGFAYTVGKPAQFARSDLETPRTRDFCPTCGTHLLTWRPGLDMPIVKVGTLDDPAVYGGADVAIFCIDLQPFHMIPDGLPRHERIPPPK